MTGEQRPVLLEAKPVSTDSAGSSEYLIRLDSGVFYAGTREEAETMQELFSRMFGWNSELTLLEA